MKKSRRKYLNEVNHTSNSSDFFKQVNFGKDPNESGQASRRHTNLNITPMDIVTNFNEKMDLNNNHYYENTPLRTSNNVNANLNPISETRYKIDEDDEKYSPRRSLSKGFGSPSRKFNNIASQQISEKEKRTILEHYRKLYSFKKVKSDKNSPSENVNNKISSFPLINTRNKQINKKVEYPNINLENKNLNTNNSHDVNNKFKTASIFYDNKNKYVKTEDNSNNNLKNNMFRSSIYSNLMPTNSNFYKSKKDNKLNENEGELNTSLNKASKQKNKAKTTQSSFGPFLHINNKFDKEIEIKNPEIKRSLEDINYYGPYFSHCPICRYKNLDFYQTMEPHQCLKLLNYIKLKRSKIKVK